MESVVIRNAVRADALGIAIVQAYTWLTTYTGLMPDEVLQSRIDHVPMQAEYITERIVQGDAYAVAEFRGTIIGFACGSPSRNESYPNDGEIQGLYVLKGFQGQHSGRKLFEYCVKKLRTAGHKHLIVNCLDGNPAEDFYLHLGGCVVGERSDEIRGHVVREKIIRFDI